jgi:hypothetical protein
MHNIKVGVDRGLGYFYDMSLNPEFCTGNVAVELDDGRRFHMPQGLSKEEFILFLEPLQITQVSIRSSEYIDYVPSIGIVRTSSDNKPFQRVDCDISGWRLRSVKFDCDSIYTVLEKSLLGSKPIVWYVDEPVCRVYDGFPEDVMFILAVTDNSAVGFCKAIGYCVEYTTLTLLPW